MNEQIEIMGEVLAVELSSQELEAVSGGGVNISTRTNGCSDPMAGGAVVCDSTTDNIRVD